jgi:hypothetical protein
VCELPSEIFMKNTFSLSLSLTSQIFSSSKTEQGKRKELNEYINGEVKKEKNFRAHFFPLYNFFFFTNFPPLLTAEEVKIIFI